MTDVYKGSLDGECFTPGCTATAARISIAEPSYNPDYIYRYRCRGCCDAIAAHIREHTFYATATPAELEAHRQLMRAVLDMNRTDLMRSASP